MGLKYSNLKKAGLFNVNADKVHDPLFRQDPDFFDAHDNLQVRYEMLRSHLVDGNSVAKICKRFGTSRQTFYSLQEKFIQEGSLGLLPKKSGPKRPSKLTPEVLMFVKGRLESQSDISVTKLTSQIAGMFGVLFHRRTIEKYLKNLRSKKNF